MTYQDNLVHPVYEPGTDLTGEAVGAVVGGTFVKISAAKQVGSEALASDSSGGNILVEQCDTLGEFVFAVAEHDAASGEKVGLLRGNKVVPVTSGAAIDPAVNSGAVMTDTAGKAVPFVAPASAAIGVSAGQCVNKPTAANQSSLVALNI